MAISDKFYSEQTVSNLATIVENSDELARKAAIAAIVESDEKDKARLFIEVFQYITWRETQGALLRAIGETKEQRGVEFLIRFIRETKDLPLASHAALGLGHSQTSLAGEFLLSLLREKEIRLRQEAIVGLALVPHFFCDDQLLEIIEDENSGDTLKLFAIVAAGRRGAKITQPAIENLLRTEKGKLYNASILALGHLATEKELESACVQDTAYQMFAQELQLYAQDRCHLRAQHKIEDLVVGVLSDTSLDWCTSFRLLSEFPQKEVWNTIQILGDELDVHTECLLRCATFNPGRAEDDIAFLIKNQNSMGSSEAAILVRLCFSAKDDKFITQLSPLNACSLLEQVYTPTILDMAENFYCSEPNSELTIAFINGIVAQSLMTFESNLQLCEFLLEKLKTEMRASVIERILRGLAQMGYQDKGYLIALRKNLRTPQFVSSTYYCLSLLPVVPASKILLERYENIQMIDGADSEISLILKRLSAFGYFDHSSKLQNIDKSCCYESPMEFLRILSSNTIYGFEEFIEEKLKNGDFSEKLLAVSACSLNGSEFLCEFLFDFLPNKSFPLRERAIHSLCLQGNAEQHYRLLIWFETYCFTPEIAMKILNTITPRHEQDYSEVIKTLERFIKQKKGPFVDDEILAEAFALHDNLSIISSEQQRDAYLESTGKHDQDEVLEKEIHAYSKYSETIKVILRNAELTWQHSELFNSLVDKSTMLIQYSKSMDLLLQSRLGYRLFHNPEEDYLPLFQSRIMELGLDSDSFSNARMIRHLSLEGFFSSKEFPGHKLKMLSQSIMSGKIMTDRFRAIDGLRAWSLILLLFARTFVVRNTKMLPILPMRRSGEEKINSIVKSMNKFQDLRNSAAHHGVLVELEQLEEIRSDSISLLNDLEDVLAGHSDSN